EEARLHEEMSIAMRPRAAPGKEQLQAAE
ncbi:acriflavin resistance protein, partial [Rhizobium sp. Pop5]